MSKDFIKILFFSDSHLGFDLPIRPRIQRRRRGHDFFSNYHRILEIAKTKKVDLVVHGGDMFFRTRVHPSIVEKAYQPLISVANAGIPIYIVPGNHERSKLPEHLWLSHKNIHVFDRPKTFLHKTRNTLIALSGFPFARKFNQNFSAILNQTNYRAHKADVHFLCVHQAFEGAKVGPRDFTFRVDKDTLHPASIPSDFSAVLSGHIHRNQCLTQTLTRQILKTPIIYPGSIERTSFAERFEEKNYVILKINPKNTKAKPIIEFHPLPTRPMVKINVPTSDIELAGVKNSIQKRLNPLNPNAIVRIEVTGEKAEEYKLAISAKLLRSLAPESMNISLAYQWANTRKN